MVEARVGHGITSGVQPIPFRVDSSGRLIVSLGGAVYPEVANFAALPAANLHSGEIYIVLNGSGVYVVNRKSAGMYLSNGSTWSRLGNIPGYFIDSNFAVYNNADNTKQIKFDCSAVTTATTRTVTWPDRDVELIGDISCSVTNTANISIPNNIFGFILPFDSERFDDDGMHDNVTNNDRITIPSGGKYLFGADVSWAANAAGTRHLVIYKNGTILMSSDNKDATSFLGTDHSVTSLAEFVAGDYLTVWVYQNSGGALNISKVADSSPMFWAMRVS